MFGRQTNIRRSMIVAMAIALFVQSACTVDEAVAGEKARVLSMRLSPTKTDFKKTVDLVRYLNMNTFQYWVIYFRAADTKDSWNTYHNVDSLESFLKYNASLGSNGIDVWVHQTKGSGNSWVIAKYLARLSLKYPRLKTFSFNDYIPEKTTPTALKHRFSQHVKSS